MVCVWIKATDEKRLDEIGEMQRDLELGRFMRFVISPTEYGLKNTWYNDIYVISEDEADIVNSCSDIILRRNLQYICITPNLIESLIVELRNKVRFIYDFEDKSYNSRIKTFSNYLEWISTGAILGVSYHSCTKRIVIDDTCVKIGDTTFEGSLRVALNKALKYTSPTDEYLIDSLFQFLPIMTGTTIEMFLCEEYGFSRFLNDIKELLLEYISIADDSEECRQRYEVQPSRYSIFTILEALNG